MKQFVLCLFTAVLAALGCFSAQGQENALFQGTGTWDDPYQIGSAADLTQLSFATNELAMDFKDQCFQFTSDIDMSGVAFKPISGDALKPFLGHIDGNRHCIMNWTVEGQPTTEAITAKPYALVLYLGKGASINGLTIDASCVFNVEGNFAPFAYDVSGSMSSCINRADITATYDVGGIVCRVQTAGQLGGCFNEGNISGVRSGFVGGIAARCAGIISRSQNTGTLSAADYGCVGGIVGECSGEVSNCLSTGTLKGESVIGGLVATPMPGAAVGASLCTAVIIPGNDISQVGAVVGVPNVQGVTFNHVCYDAQISIYNREGNKSIYGLYTRELVDTVWSGSRAWTTAPGMYPQLWQFHTERTARVQAAAVIFADGETRLTMTRPAKLYYDDTDSFWWILDGDDAFYLDDGGMLAVNATDHKVSTTLTAFHGGYGHDIPVVALPKPDIEQLNMVINRILDLPNAPGTDFNPDVNGDSVVDIDDVNMLINGILAQ